MTAVHTLSFQRNRLTNQWRAACSCGWKAFGGEDAVKDSAAVHDLDLEPAEALKVPA